jgi:catechol 2,3-dioxygenase-like lactoylglutathione lyase family enzyme
MLDHVSIAVRSLAASAAFYDKVLAPIGHRRLIERQATIGFGKAYPELWLNARPGMAPVAPDSGAHVCLRARSVEVVTAFHDAALAAGGVSDGAPGPRQAGDGSKVYFAAFIRDPDGNRIEAVTFLETG